MTQRKLSHGYRKYLREEKARIRREALTFGDQRKKIQELMALAMQDDEEKE